MNWYIALYKMAVIEDGPKAIILRNIVKLKTLMSPLKADSFVRQHLGHDNLRKMFLKIDGILLNMEGSINRGQFQEAQEKCGQISLTLNNVCEELNRLAVSMKYNADYHRFPSVLEFDTVQERIYSDLGRLNFMNSKPKAAPQVAPQVPYPAQTANVG